MLPNELTDRGRMIEQRQDLFSKVIVFLVPRTEIVVNVTFPTENRKRLEKQACVWWWGDVAKLSGVSFPFCHLEGKTRELIYSQETGCLYAQTQYLGKCIHFPTML